MMIAGGVDCHTSPSVADCTSAPLKYTFEQATSAMNDPNDAVAPAASDEYFSQIVQRFDRTAGA